MNAIQLAPPCPPRNPRSTPRAVAGIARLEFALTVIVVGVIGALALEHVARLQGSAQTARTETLAAQARSIGALAQAACFTASSPTPLAGAASAASSPSCP